MTCGKPGPLADRLRMPCRWSPGLATAGQAKLSAKTSSHPGDPVRRQCRRISPIAHPLRWRGREGAEPCERPVAVRISQRWLYRPGRGNLHCHVPSGWAALAALTVGAPWRLPVSVAVAAPADHPQQTHPQAVRSTRPTWWPTRPARGAGDHRPPPCSNPVGPGLQRDEARSGCRTTTRAWPTVYSISRRRHGRSPRRASTVAVQGGRTSTNDGFKPHRTGVSTRPPGFVVHHPRRASGPACLHFRLGGRDRFRPGAPRPTRTHALV